MRSFYGKLISVGLLLFLMALSFFLQSPLASAHSNTGMPQSVCHHQQIHINGAQSPTIVCLDGREIGKVDCSNSGDVMLWWDTDFQGDTICFSGNGFVNLKDFSGGCTLFVCHPWANNASSFALFGCALSGLEHPGNPDFPGYFATGMNGSGQIQYFKWQVSKSTRNFDGSQGVLSNDSLQSLLIDC